MDKPFDNVRVSSTLNGEFDCTIDHQVSIMSRDRAYSNGTASSGHGSEGRNSSANNTPRRKHNNYRHNDPHNNGERHHHRHDMTLLCHRVDLFDDFVPGGRSTNGGEHTLTNGGGGSGSDQTRCLGLYRGCACNTPCTFCHTVIIDHGADASKNRVLASAGDESEATLPSEIHPNLAFLFGGNLATTTTAPPATPERVAKEEDTKPTTVSRSLEIEPIFAQNHGLLCDNGHGGVRVKRYHHPPVGKYKFTPPLMELSKFFDTSDAKQNGNANTTITCHSEPTQENGAGLDSFFDEFFLLQSSSSSQIPTL